MNRTDRPSVFEAPDQFDDLRHRFVLVEVVRIEALNESIDGFPESRVIGETFIYSPFPTRVPAHCCLCHTELLGNGLLCPPTFEQRRREFSPECW